ncbi:MAG TPA: holo-ACP synthase, partial [Novosphingobium sp.]|nr:holo-ACP synthase [Novosphingobium sp.]
MILGIGTDIASIERIGAALDRHGGRFEARTFTPEEIALANSRPANRAATLAKRWAAKEACAKALGCGIAQGIALTDIAVAR